MRISRIDRVTKETSISLALDLGGGAVTVDTGIGFFDHMLNALFFYSGFGAELTARGDLHVDAHHTVEDVGIVAGLALREALGDRAGIRRYWDCRIPMDEALAEVALDISGRPFLHYDAVMPQELIGDYESCLTVEFMRALSSAAGLTLHIRAPYGDNAHHITEAIFKALGIALKYACEVTGSTVTSTKGLLQ